MQRTECYRFESQKVPGARPVTNRLQDAMENAVPGSMIEEFDYEKEQWVPLGTLLGKADAEYDPVKRPKHYTKHPSGVECITITEHMNFNLGNAMKYIWRAGLKGEAMEDLSKAAWYIERELKRIQRMKGPSNDTESTPGQPDEEGSGCGSD